MPEAPWPTKRGTLARTGSKRQFYSPPGKAQTAAREIEKPPQTSSKCPPKSVPVNECAQFIPAEGSELLLRLRGLRAMDIASPFRWNKVLGIHRFVRLGLVAVPQNRVFVRRRRLGLLLVGTHGFCFSSEEDKPMNSMATTSLPGIHTPAESGTKRLSHNLPSQAPRPRIGATRVCNTL